MAETISASIITLHQPRRAKTDAERAKAYRDRKRQKALLVVNPLAGENPAGLRDVETRPARGTHDVLREAAPGTGVETGATAIGTNIVPQTIDFGHGQIAHAVTLAPVTLPVTSRRPLASIALTVAAFALAGTGLTMNAWFARSLGSTDSAGLMFLAVGVAADLAALAVPSCAARLWETRQRGSAAFGWLIWLATFVFAVTAGIGFASTNISDVTLARASRITPVILSAQAALADAMASRDRECKGGVGKFCREREQIVNDRRQSLADAAHAVEQEADPQTEAAKRIVAWISHGWLTPSSDDFALLRLVLLALLPQVGGVLLMLSRVR